MKKNFKKSKFVILPALATLVLTGVASVTGTVAWFTANRAVSANVGPFVSTQVTSALEVTYTADDKSGTKSGTEGRGIDIDGNLTHGSYDAKENAEGNLYVARLDDSNAVTAYEDKGTVGNHVVSGSGTTTNKWCAKAAVAGENTSPAVWYGVSWKMTFKGASAEAGKTNYLLLDPASTIFNDSKNGDTVKGLRIALITSDKSLVISGDSEKKHVTGTAKESTTNFGDDKFVDLTNGSTDKKATKLEDNGSIDTSKYSLGELTDDGIEITCVAWFEGEDTNIVSSFKNGDDSTRQVVMSSVNATLAFYSRTK